MEKTPEHDNLPSDDSSTREILEWLAAVHGQISIDDSKGLLTQLLNLRIAALSNTQRQKLLDLLYLQSQSLTEQTLEQLDQITLPISRKVRHNTKALLQALETLAQEYFNSLAAVFDPERKSPTSSSQMPLKRAMQAIAWQIHVYQRISAPTPPGLWQQFHAAFSNARHLNIEQLPSAGGGISIQRLYTNTLLSAIAQPASFSPIELRLIATLIEHIPNSTPLSTNPGTASPSIFWIDPTRDFPAQALVRRPPPPDSEILYFSGDIAATYAASLLNALQGGAFLGNRLPTLSRDNDTQRVLKRLVKLWANPSKRRYPRRRQSYRSQLAIGLPQIHPQLTSSQSPDESLLSEWMVTNESPDGFSLMHMSGATPPLLVGDVVALRAAEGQDKKNTSTWQICVLRWAISENPEHIEIGLQLLSTAAKAIRIVTPQSHPSDTRKIVEGLLLPENPTLQRRKALVLPQGTLLPHTRGIVLITESNNLALHEIRSTEQDEQSSTCDILFIQAEGASIGP